jgi:adenylate cyclase class IV
VPRNIEIKARLPGCVEDLLPRARQLADGDALILEQDDTFFDVPHGRLKLRQFADGSAELIHYQRADAQEAKASDYVIAAVPDPAALRLALGRALGLRGRVVKRRWLLLAGSTRIHLDRVQGLGDCMELEVVLQDGQSDEAGAAVAEQLMHDLGLGSAPRLSGAYLDLLAPSARLGHE